MARRRILPVTPSASSAGLPSEPLWLSMISSENRATLRASGPLGPDHALLAGTRERAGTRRGEIHVARGPAATIRHADRA